MLRFLRLAVLMGLVAVMMPSVARAADQDFGSRKIRVNVAPEYPEIAKRMAIRGAVQLKVKVTAEGAVRDVEAKGGNPVLIRAAVQAVKQWRYEATGRDSVENVKIVF